MYHHNVNPSQRYDSSCSRYKIDGGTESSRIVDYSRSPNAVTATPSPTSSRIKIANANSVQRHFNNPHELDVQEFEAEADYKEYVMYQRIMQHRSSRTNSFTGCPVLIPPTLPLSVPLNPNTSFLSHSMAQRLRYNAKDRQDSFHDNDDQADCTTNTENEDDLETEVGIFELDM
jgi:hypothetical protein